MSELFFTSGGTLPPDSPSYIERQADRDLIAALGRGEYCYVLTSRQMGKSSLMLRAARRLRSEGIRVAVLDLTSLGQNVTPEQWYQGLMEDLGEQLGLDDEVLEYWTSRHTLAPLRRWMVTLKDVVLPHLKDEGGRMKDEKERDQLNSDPLHPSSLILHPSESLVVFIDEIDAVRNLPFSTDEFFAAIRECFNRRGEDHAFRRLTFCLLGVATPSDLIQDVRTTPFNIGTRIELTDFTEAEAHPLAAGLEAQPATSQGPDPKLSPSQRPTPGSLPPPSVRGGEANAQRLLQRVLYWTGGHPYLTQRLCREVAATLAGKASASFLPARRVVDAACAALFLSAQGKERDDNLLFVRDRILRGSPDLVATLELYRRICTSAAVRLDEAHPLLDQLRLSGVLSTRAAGPVARVRNRIYARVFDGAWIRRNMPDAEARRLRDAYRRGVFRTAALACVVVGMMLALTGAAVNRAGAARTAEQLAQALNRTLRTSLNTQERLNTRLQQALTEARFQRQNASRAATKAERASATAQAAQSREAGERQKAEARRKDAETARSAAQSSQRLAQESLSRILVGAASRTIDAGDLLGALPPLARAVSLDYGDPDREEMDRLRLGELLRSAPRLQDVWTAGGEVRALAQSRDGALAAQGSASGVVRLLDLRRGRERRRLRYPSAVSVLAFSPDGRRLAIGGQDGTARIWSTETGAPVSPVIRGIASLASIDWHPRGARVALAGDDGVVVAEVESGKRIMACGLPGAGEGHAVFSPDGKGLVFVASRFLGWMLDAETGEPRFPLAQCFHGYDPHFSADGARLLLGGRFGSGGDVSGARILDARTGAVQFTFTMPSTGMATGFSPDGRRVVVGDFSGNVRVFSAQTGEPVSPLVRHRASVSAVGFSPDGRQIMSAGWDGTAQVWDAASASPTALPLRHAAAVLAAGWAPGGGPGVPRRVLTVSRDGAARLWQLPQPVAPRSPLAPSMQVLQLEYLRDGNGVARYAAARVKVGGSPEEEEEVRVWDTVSGRTAIPGNPSRWRRFVSTGDGALLLLAGPEGVQLWDVKASRPVSKLQPIETREAAALSVSPRGRYLCVLHASGSSRIYALRTGEPVRADLPPLFYPVAFSPDETRMLAHLRDQTLRISDVQPARGTRPAGFKLPLHGVPNRLDFAPGREVFVVDTADRRLRVWDWRGKPRSPELRPDNINYTPNESGLSFSPDGRQALLLDYRNAGGRSWSTGLLLDLSGRTPPRRLAGGKALPGFAISRFSRDGRRVVLLGREGEAQVWDPARCAAISPVLRQGQWLLAAAFSPDERRVAIGGWDGGVVVWDLYSGKAVTPVMSHPGRVDSLEFSPDGRLLLSHTSAQTARIWDARTGEPLAQPLEVGGPVDECRFAAGTRAILALSNSRLMVRNLISERRSLAQLTRHCQLLAAHQSDANGGLQPLSPQELENTHAMPRKPQRSAPHVNHEFQQRRTRPFVPVTHSLPVNYLPARRGGESPLPGMTRRR